MSEYQLYGVSARGTRLCNYTWNKETWRITPNAIPIDPEMSPDYPRCGLTVPNLPLTSANREYLNLEASSYSLLSALQPTSNASTNQHLCQLKMFLRSVRNYVHDILLLHCSLDFPVIMLLQDLYLLCHNEIVKAKLLPVGLQVWRLRCAIVNGLTMNTVVKPAAALEYSERVYCGTIMKSSLFKNMSFRSPLDGP